MIQDFFCIIRLFFVAGKMYYFNNYARKKSKESFYITQKKEATFKLRQPLCEYYLRCLEF